MLIYDENKTQATVCPSEQAVFSKSCYSTTPPELYASDNTTDYDKKVTPSEALKKWSNSSLIKDDKSLQQKLSKWSVITDVPGAKEGLKSTPSGMQAVAYKNEETNEIVIAFCGTNSILDGATSDAQILGHFNPWQIHAANTFYKQIKNLYPGYKISLTGHSLGGAVA